MAQHYQTYHMKKGLDENEDEQTAVFFFDVCLTHENHCHSE